MSKTPSDGDTPQGTASGESSSKVVHFDFAARKKIAPAEKNEPVEPEAPPDPLSQEKLTVFTSWIEQGMVMVTLDARRSDVKVPAKFQKDIQLNLNFSHRFGIQDFAYDARGVRASLSFQGQTFFCNVPWSSVYALRSHVTQEMKVWPGSIPTEMVPALFKAPSSKVEREPPQKIYNVPAAVVEDKSAKVEVAAEEKADSKDKHDAATRDSGRDSGRDAGDEPPPRPNGPTLRRIK